MLKVKEFERFAFSAWSPANCDSVYLATVTAACENPVPDEVTCASPLLELFTLDTYRPDLEMHPTVGIEVDSKATCLCWTSSRTQSQLGLLITGNAIGGLAMYDPEALVDACESNKELADPNSNHILKDSDMLQRVKCATKDAVHTGVVRSIDSNRFQTNLFASAADEGEIFIWDIEKMDQPMIPSTRTQPLESITTVAWNPRVQHILATASAGNCVIWDLRKSESVVHLTKAMCQFEPHLMAWSPDIATRLCLADPAHPTADIQLWDLRYPKHMLALLGRWPPPPSSNLSSSTSSLGNAGNVNALAWSPAPQSIKSRPAMALHDPDLIAVSLTASGALPTESGGCGSDLEPTSADFLVVWSVNEALKSVQAEAASGYPGAVRQPVFVGRLEGCSDEVGVNSTTGGVPSTSVVHWVTSHPGLVSVTQSDGWIGVYNLDAGASGDGTVPTRLVRARLGQPVRGRLASHKVAEAFAELEIDLADGANNDERGLSEPTANAQLECLNNELVNDSAQISSYQLPQPMPRLRVPGRWNKRPCGANFGFGGRLASYQAPNDLARRPRSSASLSVSRQTSQSVGDAAATVDQANANSSTAGTEGSENARPVHIEWVDTLDIHPVGGLKSVLNCLSEEKLHDLIGSMLNWLDQILSVPLEQLAGLCDSMAEICLPHLVNCNATWKSPWELLKVQFQPSTERRTVLSNLLGFSEELVRKEAESVLEQAPETSDVEFQCPCQIGSNREVAIENLSALRLALVTGDLETAIRLCMHSSFSALACPDLSALGAVALLLAYHYQTPEFFTALQSTIVKHLDQVCDLHGAEGTHLRSVIAILVGLIKHDWSGVISRWPLEDWSTAVALLVNHVWMSDAALFRKLCGVLINRLLDPLVESSLSTEDRGTAAWACSVISTDLNGLIRAWCLLCDVQSTDRRGETFLPLAMQLLLLVRAVGCTQTVGRLVLDSTTSVPDALTVTQVLSIVALWLGQTWAGRGEFEVFMGLRLLRLIMDTTTPELNEAAHRLWCSLTDEQRARSPAKFESPFYCPFTQPGSLNRCVCGTGQPKSVISHTAHHGYRPQPAQLSAQQITQPVPLFSQPPGSVPPSSVTPHPPVHPSVGSRQPSPYFPPVQPPSGLGTPPIPIPAPGPTALNTGFRSGTVTPPQPPFPQSGSGRPWLPSATNQPVVPPPGLPTAPLGSSSTVGPPMPPVSSVMPPPGCPPLPRPYAVPPGPATMSSQPQPPSVLPPAATSMPDRNALLPSTRPATSRAWNDPPFLAKTYQPPPRPTVVTNQFYDPSEFATSGAAAHPPPLVGSAASSALHTGLNASPAMAPAQPIGQSGPFPSFGDKMSNSSVPAPPMPPLPMAGITAPMSGPSRPNPYAPPIQSPASTANSFQPPLPPSVSPFSPPGSMHQSSAQNHPLPQMDHLNGPHPQPLVPPMLPAQCPRPSLDASHWPAAQPLASHLPSSTNMTSNVNTASSEPDETASNSGEPAPAPSTIPVIAEYEAVQSSLCKLIQLCRNCGGKAYLNKMDTVDRRLQTLFTALRGGPGAHLMSDQVIRHLLDCVHAADSGDYGAAVGHANLLIQSATGFESIHSFAPALKILMQSAKQLFPNQTAVSGENVAQVQSSWPPTSMMMMGTR